MDERDISFFGSKKKDKSKSSQKLEAEPKNSKASQNDKIISRPTTEVDYRTDNLHIGLAIVLNHKNIKGQRPRNGAEKDCKDITASLENYGFQVRVYNDLKKKKISTLLNSVAAEDHSQYDCFVVVVMSHGDKGRVCAADDFYSTEELWEPLLGDKCPTLLGKPKLFFIQACRGTRIEQPVLITSRALFQAAVFPSSATVDRTMYAIPTTADILVMYSTFEDYYSFRNSVSGSWFIQSLCSILNEAAQSKEAQTVGVELLRLLTAVNRKVAYEYQSYSDNESINEKKEMPNFMSTLTKTFYLRVKPKNADAKIDDLPDDEVENDFEEKIHRIFNTNADFSALPISPQYYI
ncbi:caspase-3 [Bactrocera dorsalis]|uniref:Caspase-3 n=1 Tax=Bactrocera dorsalis TaxID=27457 RepID=A0A6I9V2T6_BACDO|nr:caspase-3 [Bactrocera dorsalis]XP_011202745.2 caspase-3 [Bactrocera dorsalis]